MTFFMSRFMLKSCVFSILSVLLVNFFLVPTSFAHFIQIDQHEFRASGFPKPHLPPPLPIFEEIPQHLQAKELTPSELMVDLTNDLTYRILHYHSILNRNNFAYSPTALMSILVALYEGSTGRSAVEIRNVLQLPNNRDVIRVGYRDIHRRLRTYFFGSDNPLKGLSLNKDNVTITKEYEAVLMFYGYDLGVDMISSQNITEMLDSQTTTIVPSNETLDTTILPETTIKAENDSGTESTTPGEMPTQTIMTTETVTIAQTTEETTTESTTIAAQTETATEEATTEETVTEKDVEGEDGGEAAELVSAFVADADSEPLLRIEKARVSRLPTKLQSPAQFTKIKSNYLPAMRSAPMSARIIRHKRHLIAEPVLTLFNSDQSNAVHFAQLINSFHIDLTSQLSSKPGLKQNYNTDVISHVFYLNHRQTVFTTFKVYNAVLYYKYFENLKLSVLELELDTPEYNLMILLPDFHTDLVTTAASLRIGPTLRILRKQLKPRWVQAIIPDFKLHGTMFLTNDLQNMGILDIFEPNRANFQPMTEESVYVKHIEQSININIRTHPINQLKRNYGSQTQPIQISVNHPYLFFIIDRDLDVAVMAGRVLNPLNVRIQ